MRGPALLLLSAAAALCAACDGRRAEIWPTALPSLEELPAGFNEDCGCVESGQCAILDEVLGTFERRSLSCRWIDEGKVADCSFEERFIELFPAENGTVEPGEPSPWQKRRLRARLLPSGRWCAGQ